MWAALTLIILLIFLSIYGAFLGAERAGDFFNSLPLVVYWSVLAALLITALAVFGRLRRVPGLLLMHAGCILVVLGAMWGSEAGHKLQRKLFGLDKIKAGQMIIHEGYSENKVVLKDDEQVGELPFSIGLKAFRIEYYQPAHLQVQTRQDKSWTVPVEIGTEFQLGPDFGTVTVVKAFENFRITIDGDNKMAIDDLQSGSNPALEVRIKYPDGSEITRYVFERFPGHSHPEDEFLLSYHRTIRDYISDLQVIENGKVATEASIEVNHPLRFGGYYFYQSSYDAEAGQYTVLSVTSDTGLTCVYAGYIMLCVGVFRHFWFRHLFSAKKKKTE